MWFIIFTLRPLVTMKSYGGLFHCMQCRCSIRWLLLMWAYEKTPRYYYGRCGQLCVQRIWLWNKPNAVNARNASVASFSCFALWYFPASSTTLEYFVLHLSALFILGVCGFLIKQPGSPLSNIRNANGWWGWGLPSCLRGNRCWVKCCGGSLPRSDCPSSLPLLLLIQTL